MRIQPLRTRQEARPVPQRHQVGGPQVDARQEARQPRGGRHVVRQLQGRTHVLHSGLIQQATQSHNLRGDTGLPQGGIDQREVLATPAEDCNRSPLAVLDRLRAHPLHEVDHRRQGLVVGLRIGDLDPALPRARTRHQNRRLRLERVLTLLIGSYLPQRCCHAIRRVQNRHVVAPRGGQGEGLVFLGAPRLKALQERLQGRGRGPPPPVNRLIRVAHRSNSVVAEQRGEQLHLDDGRVLELVEEDRAELIAQRDAHGGCLAHDARCQDQLIRKIENTHVALALLVSLDRP